MGNVDEEVAEGGLCCFHFIESDRLLRTDSEWDNGWGTPSEVDWFRVWFGDTGGGCIFGDKMYPWLVNICNLR